MNTVSKDDVLKLITKLKTIASGQGFGGKQRLATGEWFQKADALTESMDVLKALHSNVNLGEKRIKSLKARLYCNQCLYCPACERLHWLEPDDPAIARDRAAWEAMMPPNDLPPKVEGMCCPFCTFKPIQYSAWRRIVERQPRNRPKSLA